MVSESTNPKCSISACSPLFRVHLHGKCFPLNWRERNYIHWRFTRICRRSIGDREVHYRMVNSAIIWISDGMYVINEKNNSNEHSLHVWKFIVDNSYVKTFFYTLGKRQRSMFSLYALSTTEMRCVETDSKSICIFSVHSMQYWSW